DPDMPFRALLEEYRTQGGAPPDPGEDARRRLEDLLRDLAAVPHTVTVTGPAGGQAGAGYTLTASTRDPLPIPAGYHVGIEPLSRSGDAHRAIGGRVLSASWTGVPLPDVTPFLAVRATSPEGLHGGTVIRAELVGDPAGRLDAV